MIRQDNPTVRGVLTRMAAAHRALPGLRARYAIVAHLPDRVQTMMEGTIAFARPGSARVDGGLKGETWFVSAADGRSLTVARLGSKRYWRIPVANNGSAIYHAFASPGPFDYLILALAAGRSVYGGDTVQLRVEADETVNGVPCDVVSFTSGTAASAPRRVTIAVGKNDHLLRRHTATDEDPDGGKSTVTFTELKVGAPPAETFAVSTSGFQTIDPQIDWARTLVPGAEPPPLLGEDLFTGKEIDLEALKGKVVVVHFWGTVGPRSVWGLPDLVAARKAMAGRKDVAFVGVTVNDRSQGRQVRAALKAARVDWPVLFDGLAWDSAPAKLWKIQALPFVAVVGRDGRLAAIDPGGPDIEAEVRQALAKR